MTTYDDGYDDDNWRALGSACLGYHNALWYPPVDPSCPSHTDIGKMICERCPVWRRCLQEGMDERWGIWGGLSPKERQVINYRLDSPGVAHGSVTKYRQGCTCAKCHSAEHSKKVALNMSVLPRQGDPLPPVPSLKKSLRTFD